MRRSPHERLCSECAPYGAMFPDGGFFPGWIDSGKLLGTCDTVDTVSGQFDHNVLSPQLHTERTLF